MGAFELHEPPILAEKVLAEKVVVDQQRIKDECIIAQKVYDSCRRQNCLTPTELGPARAACQHEAGESKYEEGEVIHPHHNATSVTMDDVKIKKIKVVDKQPSPFRQGYWDVDIRFVFEYRLTFREAGGCKLHHVDATSQFNMKSTLFGSTGADLVIGTDLYKGAGETFSAAPFIWVEAKAIGLDAKIYHGHGHGKGHHKEVHVTIGLFSILKLFRLVHLNVQSKGFCIPNECADQGSISPCEYFEELDFPMDIFAPPQKH